MNVRVSEEFGMYFARIPLKTSPHIVNGNALTLDWNDVLPAEKASYVLGNPPFVGAKFMDDAQRKDVQPVFADIKSGGLLDFVAAWYVKAGQYISHPAQTHPSPPLSGREQTVPPLTRGGREGLASAIRCAFVSTNSITQGEQAGVLWGWLLKQGFHIHFAHRTFSWSNEARGVAAVHCVIIGFGAFDVEKKTIYEYEDIRGEAHAVSVRNINPYLVDAPDVVLEKRNKPICNIIEMAKGSQPTDGGHLLLDAEQRQHLLAAEPKAASWIRHFMGAEEFINGIERWCLWLKDCPPNVLRSMPDIVLRVEEVKKMRLASKKAATREWASRPTLFTEDRQPETNYLIVPSVSSERRNFIPIGFISPEIIASNLCLTIANATLFHFGILTSTMHMAWVRYTCGRLKSDYRYSASIVYNNYPWPNEPSDKQRATIETAAQAVLDARAQFQQSSLADLYDPLTMPPALVKAHQTLDRAVDACYRKAAFPSDAQRVEFLFERYQQLTSLLPTEKKMARKKSICS
jgi:hypothetical protein